MKNEKIEIKNSKKEYTTPQMEVMDFVVQKFLCDSDPEYMGVEEE